MEAPIAAFVRYVPWLTDEDSLRRLFRNAHLCEPNGFRSGFRSCQMQLAGITIEGHMAQLGGVQCGGKDFLAHRNGDKARRQNILNEAPPGLGSLS